MNKKNDNSVYHDSRRFFIESMLMELRRANLRSPLPSDHMAVYCALCEASRRMA